MNINFMDSLPSRLHTYQLTAIFSLVFAIAGFSYNAWRMAESEHNNTIRTASFETLIQLSELEQLIYAAYYDKDINRGNPRQGWLAVGLISDLSYLSGTAEQQAATALTNTWEKTLAQYSQ